MNLNDILNNISNSKQEDNFLCDQSLTGKWDDYVPTSENFHDSLKVEKVGQSIADEFYKRCLDALQIRRYDYNNPEQRFLQKLDVDCSIQLYAKSLDVFWLNISEKFRQCDTGDMCIELWSDFEGRKPGWAIKPTHTNEGPDYYLYTTPKYFYEICTNKHFYNMIDQITQQWDHDRIKSELDVNGREYCNNCSIPISVGGHDATLIKTWTKFNEDKKWFGVCICIPWKTLFNDYLIDIRVYDRKYNKLNINTLN